MTSWLDRLHRRQEQVKQALRNTLVHNILGERLFHPHLWTVDKGSIAGGLSLGLFIAFTPTIPFQMLLGAAGAMVFRVNLPVSMAACWITNPFTALPIYLAARRIGRLLLEQSVVLDYALNLSGFDTKAAMIVEQSLYLGAGSLIFSTIAALSGNLFARLAWNLLHWLKDKALGGDSERSY